ncbi:hypothetical protein [Leptolyngbya sp. BL0902]|uniref:hypothetical protein n=1 Tax=Leptolyngbya sp. BL0902 TaxID=1115757 RepID=UPI0018E76905|nr:hypothetical protein [Leptolyngbya sp. BL0902]
MEDDRNLLSHKLNPKMNVFQKNYLIKNMKILQSIVFIPLTASILFLAEGVNPRSASARFIGSLHSGQRNYVDYNLGPGTYVLNASTILGDVDIRIYDATRRNLLLEAPNRIGNESFEFTVNHGGTFSIQYSMFGCINPLGACPVSLEVIRR